LLAWVVEHYCAARGEVSYYQNVVDPTTGSTSRIRWVGSPCEERQAAPLIRPTRREAVVAGNLPQFIEPVDCEIFANPAMADLSYVTDSQHRHFLVFGSNWGTPVSTDHLFLTNADGSGRIGLPIYRGDVSTALYRTFDPAFFVWNASLSDTPASAQAPLVNSFRKWRETKYWPFWRVETETKKVERICIPYGAGSSHRIPAH
jgi:hypothetical protein